MALFTAKEVYTILEFPANFDDAHTRLYKELGYDYDMAEMRNAIQKYNSIKDLKDSPEKKYYLGHGLTKTILPEEHDKQCDAIFKKLTSVTLLRGLKADAAKYVNLDEYEAYLKVIEDAKKDAEQPAEGPQQAGN
jgi:2-hydroxy-3-keto-5-methylthiopentenyl-1-phosphate phosphatase